MRIFLFILFTVAVSCKSDTEDTSKQTKATQLQTEAISKAIKVDYTECDWGGNHLTISKQRYSRKHPYYNYYNIDDVSYESDIYEMR
jgi:hypothetical protein